MLHRGVVEAARESLAGSVPVGGGFAEPAREAFASGLVVVAVLGAAICLVLALLAGLALRHLAPSNETTTSGQLEINVEDNAA